jgi:hypothetical protein
VKYRCLLEPSIIFNEFAPNLMTDDRDGENDENLISSTTPGTREGRQCASNKLNNYYEL